MNSQENGNPRPKKDQKTPSNQEVTQARNEKHSTIHPQVIHIKEFLGHMHPPNQELAKTQQAKLPAERQHRSKCPCGPGCKCGPECKCNQQGKHSCSQNQNCSKQTAFMQQSSKQRDIDLIDLDLEPEIIHPELKTNTNQEELRRQIYNQTNQGQQLASRKQGKFQVERKQELTPRTADKILKEINEEENQQKKRASQSKRSWKKKPSQGIGQATKGTLNKQNKGQVKERTNIEKQNESSE